MITRYSESTIITTRTGRHLSNRITRKGRVVPKLLKKMCQNHAKRMGIGKYMNLSRVVLEISDHARGL